MTTQIDLDAVVQRAMARAMAMRRLPESTYRVQFHKGFTFRDAAAIVPYLADLGITHLYASPYLKATPGSTHGYDVIDHASLNPEHGTRARHADYFDITWRGTPRPQLDDKVLLPVLGGHYGDVLENGELQLTYE